MCIFANRKGLVGVGWNEMFNSVFNTLSLVNNPIQCKYKCKIIIVNNILNQYNCKLQK